MSRALKWFGAFCAGAIVALAAGAYAVQTNYLGVVFIADPTTLTQQACVTALGGICIDVPAGVIIPVRGGDATGTRVVGTITTGGTSQQMIAAQPTRQDWQLQNPCDQTESLFWQYSNAASVSGHDSFELAPCGTAWPNIAERTEAINITAATTGHPFVAYSVP